MSDDGRYHKSVGENPMRVWECWGVGEQHWRREGLAPTAAAPTIGSATPCQTPPHASTPCLGAPSLVLLSL